MTTAPLPIALTISGAVALGAYEGGALAALLHGLEPLYRGDEPSVRIDAIGGASAGSITALLAARCITEGMDAFDVMRSAWVEHAAFAEMRSHHGKSPLAVEPLETLAAGLLRMPGVDERRQRHPVRISMALGALRGLEYEIRGPFSTSPLRATTYLDWKDATVTPGQDWREFVHDPSDRTPPGRREPTLVDFALASGANPLGFSPRVVNRHADAAEYRDHHVLNFPTSEAYWYTDGGTLDNEPLGRTLDMAGDLDRNGTHAAPAAAPHPPASDGRAVRSGVVGSRATNPVGSRRSCARSACKPRRASTTTSGTPTRPTVGSRRSTISRSSWRKRWTSYLSATGSTPGSRSSSTRPNGAAPARGAPAPAPRPAARTTSDLLRDALGVAAGLTGKQAVGIEVLSPLLLPEVRGAPGKPGLPVEDVLAGEFLFHFGGFAREALRQQDFDLGYRTVLEWFRRDRPLAFHGLDGSADDEALDAATHRYRPPEGHPLGKTGLKTLSGKEQLGFADLLARMARAVWHGWRHPTHQ